MSQATTRVQVKSAPPGAVYVGRPNRWVPKHLAQRTEFGNPFRLWTDSPADRDQVVKQYHHYLLRQPDLLRALPSLRGETLACWCRSDLRCHVDVLIELLEEFGDAELAAMTADVAPA